jgi:hypothetical protein
MRLLRTAAGEFINAAAIIRAMINPKADPKSVLLKALTIHQFSVMMG